MKKILLIGSKGQLGSEILRTSLNYSEFSVNGINFPEIDVTHEKQLEQIIDQQKPDIIISTAAFHNVDLCETETQNAYAVNTIGALNLARISQKHGIKFVTFSTDYVFDDCADKLAFTEKSCPNPQSVYAASKLAGETLTMIYNPESIIIRTCGLYGQTPPEGKDYNFPQVMLKLASEGKAIKVVNDQICTPTWTKPLSEVIFSLLETDITGIIHATSQGSCNWFEFAEEIFRIRNIKADLSPISTREYGQLAKRPAFSVLENAKLKSNNLDTLPHWKDGLKQYLTLYNK